MDRVLKTWIAESESWQSFMDFALPEEARADYPFIHRIDDYYMSLMYNCLSIVKEGDFESNIKDILAVAKGLEIFSLKDKRDYFEGVNHSDNILFAATLYYLSNYSASAWILSKIYPKENYKSEIEMFISGFIKRELDKSNEYNKELLLFLETGNFEILESLKIRLKELTEEAFNLHSYDYISFLLASAILEKFSTDNIWYDLLDYNEDIEFWKPFVERNIKKKVPIWNFFPSQKEAIKSGVLSKETYSLLMPTSSGKTSISELIIYNEIKSNQSNRILYLAPFRALASELKTSLAINLASLGIKSKTIYGGNLPTVEERNSIQEVNLLIATPEKFMAIEDIFPGIHEEFNTIICDEGHLLDDSTRGLSYELLLSRLKEDDSYKKKFVFISAIIPNIDVINSWLGGNENTLVSSNYRPTQLEFAFLKRMPGRTLGYYLDINPTEQRPQNYQLYRYLYDTELKIKNPETDRNNNISSKKGISAAVAIKATKSGSVALFAPHKRGNTGVEGLAEEVKKQLEWNKNNSLIEFSLDGYIESLIEYFSKLFGADYLLVESIKFGFLYHHGDFPQGVREIIEDALRSGYIKLVICTNTLAEGVNLPIKSIVIHSTRRFNPNVIGNYENLNIRDLKNLVGRAGRAGKETKGFVIVPHTDDFNSIKNVIKETNIEPVKGQLYNIIQLITNALQQKRLQLTSEILEELDDYFQTLLDSIDLSMIDLLAVEVDNETLSDLVKQLVSQTFSFYQSNENEKETLENIFMIRAEKLRPFIESGEFEILKGSGTSIRLFDDIKGKIEFSDEIWLEEFSPLDERWLEYILDNGLFKLSSYNLALASFNELNNCNISNDVLKQSIILWMNGMWFHEISNELELQIYQTLRLINSFLSFTVQSIISSIIRIKELIDNEFVMFAAITNWPSLLQHGISKQQELDLIEMGLIDREAVLGLSKAIDQSKYKYTDYKSLKNYLITNQDILIKLIPDKWLSPLLIGQFTFRLQ